MSSDDLEAYEAELELTLLREYRDVCRVFTYVVESERRFYLANEVDRRVVAHGGRPVVEVELTDAWVWDMYRPSRFVPKVTIMTFRDVNIEQLPESELETPRPCADSSSAGTVKIRQRVSMSDADISCWSGTGACGRVR